MKLLICTSFDFRVPCAGLNRLERMRQSMERFGISSIMVASGPVDPNKDWEVNDAGDIAFRRESYHSWGHSRAMRIAGEAKKFYREYLAEIAEKFGISGVIVYTTQGQLVEPIIKVGKKEGLFVVADVGEYYRFSAHFFLNGMIFQQALLKHLYMKELSGVIVPSLAWENHAEKCGVSHVMIPGFAEETPVKRLSPSDALDDVNILYMGKLVGRELPDVIMKALSICYDKGLKFSFNVVGGKVSTYREKFWLWYVNRYKSISQYVTFHGFVSNETRDQMLADADMFILLRASNSETAHIFPSRVPEYMLSGNPVLMSSVPPLDHYFEDGCGISFISPLNDPDELAQLIFDLSADPVNRFEIGRCGREYARDHFSFDVMGERLNRFMRKLDG